MAHQQLKDAMKRDGVPTLAVVEEVFGVAHRTLHRYREEDESEHIKTSRALDSWLAGAVRVVRIGDTWQAVPGPGPCAGEAEWQQVQQIDAFLAARADELAAREGAIKAMEQQVAALRAVAEIRRESAESGLHVHDVPISVVVMKLLDSLTLERYTGDKTPVPDGKDVRFTLTGADVKFLEQAARSKGTSRNELVRAIVRKMREEVGEGLAA